MDKEELLVVVKALDKIITSERKEIKDAFRELMIMATLCEDSGINGPLSSLMLEMDKMKDQINMIQHEIRRESIRDQEYYRRYYDRTTTSPGDIWWGGSGMPKLTSDMAINTDKYRVSNTSLSNLQDKYKHFFLNDNDKEEE